MLGGNLGDTGLYFSKAIDLLNERVGPVVSVSEIYISEPWGISAQPVFRNQAIVLKTSLSPVLILEQTKKIESLLGRIKREVNGPREIDIDILLIENLVFSDSQLDIPHPRLHLRKFNLLPLAEIAADWIHPVFHESISELLTKCEDELQVTKQTDK